MKKFFLQNSIKLFLLIMAISFSGAGIAQNNEYLLNGIVSDSLGVPVQGVTIHVLGEGRTQRSDYDGKFSIKVRQNSKLQFTHIGFKKSTVSVSGKKELKVTIYYEDNSLENLIVIGYGTVDKRDNTGAISSVKPRPDNENRIISINEALQGKVAGANIYTNSGEPGAPVTFNIRGVSSISGSNQPLIVLDGQPIESGFGTTQAGIGLDGQTEIPPLDPLAGLNPADIESIEVLKDASSTAIYGSRGANGVVLITTKSGKNTFDNDRLSYSTRFDLSSIPKKIPVLSAREFMMYENEAAVNEGLGVVYNDYALDSLANLYGNVNWQDLAYQTARSQEHQLSLSGNSSKGNYLVSGNFSDNQGVVNNASFKRGAFRVNLDRKFSKKLSFSLRSSLGYTARAYQGHSSGSQVFEPNLVLSALAISPLNIPFSEDGDLDMSLFNNPVIVSELKKDNTNTTLVVTNMSLTYELLKGLTYNIKGGINDVNTLRQVYWPRGTRIGDDVNGSATRATNVNRNYMIDHLLTYKKSKKGSSLNVVLGYSYQEWIRKQSSVSSTGFPSDELGYENIAMAENQGITYTSHRTKALQSVLGRANYSFKSKYLITFTGRADGSSQLAPGNKWYFFPSMALGWNVAKERFFSNKISFIDELKIRASYGITGNDNIGIGASQALYTENFTVIGGNIIPGLSYSSFANTSLGWERTEAMNLGVDLSILKDRMQLKFDAYQRNTYDLLINLSLPGSATFTSYSTNIGRILNKGIEFEGNFKILSGKTLNWTAFANFSVNRNEVKNLGPLENLFGKSYFGAGTRFLGQPLQIAKPGHPIAAFWGYKTAGVYQNPLEVENDPYILNDPNKPNIEPGDVRFVDINGDGKITEDDKTIIGKPVPDFSIGFGSSFGYKSWSLNFNLFGNFGQDLINLNQWVIGIPTNNASINITKDAWENRWTGEGTSNKYPKANQDVIRLNGRFPDWMVEDASFLRLQNVTISKGIRFINVLKGLSAKIYISGTNLFTLTKYSGYDPATNSQGDGSLSSGLDIGTLPQARTFSLGLVLNY